MAGDTFPLELGERLRSGGVQRKVAEILEERFSVYRSGQLVGWYHSHPDLGAFFSGTDRRTQQHFFNWPYSVGLVIDPARGEEAWFIGFEAAPLEGSLLEFSSDA